MGPGARAAPAAASAAVARAAPAPTRRVKIITENPGITPSEIAERLGIQPNYMYRVMNELQKDKLVRKKGRGYFTK